MMTIGTTTTEIGLSDRPGERAVVMAVIDGKIRHAYASDAAGMDVDDFEALYIAGGLFRDGAITGNTGRSQANLTRVVYLQFDVDLLDFYGAANKSEREALLEELGRRPQADLDADVALVRAALEETFAALSVPIHRLDYTGYGLCAYVYLAEADQTKIEDCRAAHRHLVAIVNKQFGGKLVDDQVSDAGTRVTRLPGSRNRKGGIERVVTTLIAWDGATAPLRSPAAPRPITHIIPAGPGLTSEDAAAVIAAISPHWSLGQKHAMGLAVSALLAKARIPEEQALAIVEQLSANDAKPWDRRSCVASTYARMRSGGQIAGYSKLVALMPATVVDYLDHLLGRYRNATAGTVTIGDFDVISGAPAAKKAKAPEQRAAFEPTEIPDLSRYGWIGEYINLVEPTTESPDAFHMACGLTMIGACIGRRVALFHSSERMLANFYTLLIGPSGRARKDTAIKRSLVLPQLGPPPGSLMLTLGVPFRVTRDVSSAEGLISRLSKTPNLYFYVTEFAKLMHNATRESTSSISPTLMEAFDGPPTLQNNVKRDEDSREAVNPYLSIMAAVQPEILAQLIGDSQQYSGFLNRWLLIVGDGKGPRPSPPNLNETDAWLLMKRAMDAIGSYAEGTMIAFSGDAERHWDEWYVKTYPQGDTSAQEDAMGIRLGTLAKKIALIHAVLDRAPCVHLAHLEAAIATVDWVWDHTRRLLPTWGESSDARMARQIVEVLARRGPILSKRKVQQLAGNRAGPGVFARVVKAMVENGELVVTAENMIAIAPEAEAC